jgi:hypothetical protein
MADMVEATGHAVALTNREWLAAGGSTETTYIFVNRAKRIADGVLTNWRSEGTGPDTTMAQHPDLPNPALYGDFVVIDRMAME